MKRNPGTTIDVAGARVEERDGCWYPLERLAVSGDTLYYGRPVTGIPLFTYHERWLLPAQGWAVSRFVFAPGVPAPMDWYIETDLIEVDGPRWRIRDCYLDVELYEGVRYELRDADELAAGLRARQIPLAEALSALEALHRLCGALRTHGFSGAALLRAYAPGLPCAPPPSARLTITPEVTHG